MAHVDVEHRPPPSRGGFRADWKVLLAIVAIFAIGAWVTCAAFGFPG